MVMKRLVTGGRKVSGVLRYRAARSRDRRASEVPQTARVVWIVLREGEHHCISRPAGKGPFLNIFFTIFFYNKAFFL